MVHRVTVGITAALFLIIRVSNTDTPLVIGPSGVTGWLVFACQLATWLVLALQRATYYHGLLTIKDPIGRTFSPAARLLELSITGTFGLLLWATLFAPWLFFAPLLLLHWWLSQRRAAMTLYRYGLSPTRTEDHIHAARRWADGTRIDAKEIVRLRVLRESSAAAYVLAAAWIVAAILSTFSPMAQGVAACTVAILIAGLVVLQYGHLASARQKG